MQSALNLGDEHLSPADLEKEILALALQVDAIEAQILRKREKLKWVLGGVVLRCAHCSKEYPYRELTFIVEERYSHTPAYEDAVYVEQNWGYRCLRCNKTSWWNRQSNDEVKSQHGIRKYFKSVETIQAR